MLFHDDGRIEEVEPPATVLPDTVIVLQPYGALFFATASTLLEQMPTVTPESRNSVVILRVRGADDAGATLIDVLETYAASLREVDSKLMMVTDNERVIRQLRVTGATDVIGAHNLYRSNAFIGETTRQAHKDALGWVEANRSPDGGTAPDQGGWSRSADSGSEGDQDG